MLYPDPKKDDLAPPLRGEFELLKTRYSPTMNASSDPRDGFGVKLAALDERSTLSRLALRSCERGRR
jgi:hypothetical protein